MAERIAFRGKTQTELAGLAHAEYVPMVRSRMRRSIKRNANEYRKLVEKVEKHIKSNSDKPVRTHTREAVILPSWVGIRFEVYNGKEFVPVHISAVMLGHRLGEYSPTTKHVQHSAPGIRATRGSKFLAVK